MKQQEAELASEVTEFLSSLDQPLRKEIDQLRQTILNADPTLSERIKWNGPNYALGGEDRITIKIQPPKQLQRIFHRGAKVQPQPPNKLINNHSGLLVRKTNDRAVATFKTIAAITAQESALVSLVQDWLKATSGPMHA